MTDNFSMNFKDFDQKFFRLVMKTIPEAGEKGLYDAGAVLLQDAKDEPPQAPFKKGDLRGSGKVEADITSKAIGVLVIFDIEYASKVHEMEGHVNWTTDHVANPGAKYLESKMSKNKLKYMRIAVDSIEKAQ